MSHFVYCVNYKHKIQIDKNTFGCVPCLLDFSSIFCAYYICLYGLFVYLRIMHALYAFICIIFHNFCKLFRSNEAELLADGLALR